MAGRKEARIFASIWNDEVFLALTPREQRLYFFLLSQKDLSYCGVISLRMRRWARSAEGLTAAQVEEDLKALSRPFQRSSADGDPVEPSRPLIVVDEDTEEVFVRSLIRLDGIWAMPNVLKAAREAATLVESPTILAELLEELRRIPVHQSKSHNVKPILDGFIADLERSLGKGSGTPPPKGSADPSSNPQPSPSPNRSPEADDGSKEEEPPPPEPSAGSPSTPGSDAPDLFLISGAQAKPKKRRSKRKPNRTPEDDVADGLTNGYWERYSKTTAQSWIAIRQIILTALRNEIDRDDLAFALNTLGQDGRPVTQNTLTFAITDVRQRRGLRPTGTSGGHRPYQNPADQSAYDESL
ncbi:hypothetical protein GCM10023085_45870 [Actinomadura viridis]|uniref:Uncharacterized protein n=1 Tax=Actinomadura viridis TaxID=58110 RepID=A0A931DIF7_9ACTN|nr:hypothetical protein [Actinomadura viridis]MBG6089947.1 hypothetical protein [Actinomadura viridis]